MEERLEKINEALQRCEKAAEKLMQRESALRQATAETVDELDWLLSDVPEPASDQEGGANG